jgi:hypothetical protein
VSYEPDSKILTLSENGVFPNWNSLKAERNWTTLVAIPYVATEADAAGFPVAASEEMFDARARELALKVAAGPVTIGRITKPAFLWWAQDPAVFMTDATEFRPMISSQEDLDTFNAESYQDDIIHLLTDAEYATDQWFYNQVGHGVPAFTATTAIKKVTSQDIPMLTDEMQGRFTPTSAMYWVDFRAMDDQPALNQAKACQETDESEILGMGPTCSMVNTQHGCGAIIILEWGETAEGKRTLKPVAIRAAMTKEDGTKKEAVFVKGISTNSAWIFALLEASCAATQVGVGVNHIYKFHVSASAFQQQFYHNIGPEHSLMIPFRNMTQYTMQFDTKVLDNTQALVAYPYYNYKSDLSQFLTVIDGWNALAEEYPYYMLYPSRWLAKNGITKEDFTETEDWDLFPHAKFQTRCEEAAKKFVAAVVDYFYHTDEQVLKDQNVQDLATGMQDVGKQQPTISGKVETKDELKECLGAYITQTVSHGSARIKQYMLPQTLVPKMTPSFMSTQLVDEGDQVEYNMEDYLQSLPDTGVLNGQWGFLSYFSTAPWQVIVPTTEFGEAAQPPPFGECHTLNSAWNDLQTDVKSIYNEGYGLADASNYWDQLGSWPTNQEA